MDHGIPSIAFDVGGVLSKRPHVFIPILHALQAAGFPVYVLSDMHPQDKIIAMLELNGIEIDPADVISANYKEHGEMCKTVACESYGIDLLIDDFPGYVAEGDHVRLLMMPDPREPYYHPDWKTDGSEGDFGRRTFGKDNSDA